MMFISLLVKNVKIAVYPQNNIYEQKSFFYTRFNQQVLHRNQCGYKQ